MKRNDCGRDRDRDRDWRYIRSRYDDIIVAPDSNQAAA